MHAFGAVPNACIILFANLISFKYFYILNVKANKTILNILLTSKVHTIIRILSLSGLLALFGCAREVVTPARIPAIPPKPVLIMYTIKIL